MLFKSGLVATMQPSGSSQIILDPGSYIVILTGILKRALLFLTTCLFMWNNTLFLISSGLAIVFAEDAPDAAASNPPNGSSTLAFPLYSISHIVFILDAWLNLCPQYDANNPDSHLA